MKFSKFIITWSNGDRQVVYHTLSSLEKGSSTSMRHVKDEELNGIAINMDHVRQIEPRGLFQVQHGEWVKVEE